MERTRYREKTRLSLDRVFGPCNKDVRGEKKTADHNDSQKKKRMISSLGISVTG